MRYAGEADARLVVGAGFRLQVRVACHVAADGAIGGREVRAVEIYLMFAVIGAS